MKLININPVGNIAREYDQRNHMFLTHLVLKNPMYAKVAKECKGFKILDNSLIECGDALDIEEVLKAGAMIGAHEIILPDVFRKGVATVKAVESALDYILEHNSGVHIRLMAVVQGENEDAWWRCFETLNKIDEIDTLGIPKVCAKMSPRGRREFIPTRQQTKKELHLLGLWYSFAELLSMSEYERVRSCDTVLPSFLAKYDLDWLDVRPDGYTLDLENDVVSPYKVNAILRNIGSLTDMEV